jgi:hypothetical protein
MPADSFLLRRDSPTRCLVPAKSEVVDMCVLPARLCVLHELSERISQRQRGVQAQLWVIAHRHMR